MYAPAYTILELGSFNSVDFGHMDYKLYIIYNCSCLSCVPVCAYRSQDLHTL